MPPKGVQCLSVAMSLVAVAVPSAQQPAASAATRPEFAPDVAEDQAQVLSLDKEACVQYGCFEDVLLTKEWSRLTRGEVEHKYYARDVGFIVGVMVKGGNERTELVRITHGTPPRD